MAGHYHNDRKEQKRQVNELQIKLLLGVQVKLINRTEDTINELGRKYA